MPICHLLLGARDSACRGGKRKCLPESRKPTFRKDCLESTNQSLGLSVQLLSPNLGAAALGGATAMSLGSDYLVEPDLTPDSATYLT